MMCDHIYNDDDICIACFEPHVEYRRPPLARNTDPGTSHAAARSVKNQRESQAAVLAIFKVYGAMTDEQLVRRYAVAPKQSPSGLRTRRHELVDLGELRDSGRKATMETGRKAVIWECV